MRVLSIAALIVGVILIPSAVGLVKLERDREASRLDRTLVAETDEHAAALDNYFERSRSIVRLVANSPAFAHLVAAPGSREQKVQRRGRDLRDVTRQLSYLEQLYPASIGEACLISAAGAEFARAVRGAVAPAATLSTQEKHTSFFAPTFALDLGQVYQAKPYVSPDTHEWVVSNSTLIPQPGGRRRAIVHFEVTIESFRRAIGSSDDADLRVVDAATGDVIIDGRHPQRIHALLGAPGDRTFASMARGARQAGVTEVAGRRVAYRHIRATAGNANDWMLVASAALPATGLMAGAGPAPLAMLAIAFLLILIAGVSLRTSRRQLETQAKTDALTGLGNRRRLEAELERRARAATADDPVVLTFFDLNGFKSYNDTFGHPAGDELLVRLSRALRHAVRPFGGRAYRAGGDEFCVIAPTRRLQALEQAACAALSETGEGFDISTAFGSVTIPTDARDPSEAMRIADEAMYAQKVGSSRVDLQACKLEYSIVSPK